ncbi:Transporter, major facilitator family protein [Nostocoides japonicum T1-X7]|uniref:Transporter, major facilitator family protein n=1 Tax=Nostocoides japonicum T1-X7 TaxID=1194083 RepID=A0A077M1Q7_9MICO|nr:MFS transporter [Tetrasphaera japonica]CCH79012.1 Transporter, major facilitator family protein [Tetrasphaera japonica T1-X7]
MSADAVAERSQPSLNRGMPVKVLAAGSVGQFIEFYDFALYGLTALTLAELFFPGEDGAAGLLKVFATFGVAFLARPVGGLFFGNLGDRIGRRRVLFITLMAIGLATFFIGLLPTYAQVGVLAPAALVLCRIIQGFSAGGESVGAPAFVFEHAPTDRRGMWLNLTLAATALPSVVAGSFLLILSQTLSAEQFSSWGWRIPFLLALPLALAGVWIRTHTEESPAFREVLAKHDEHEMTPIRATLRRNKTQIGQVIVVMGLAAMAFYFVSAYFVSYVQTAGDLSRGQSLLVNAIALGVFTVLLPLTGRIGDRVGRRPMLIAGSALFAVAAIPSFMLVTSGSVGWAMTGQLLLVVVMTVYGGGCYTFFVEIFRTRTRFTSAAIAYNASYALFGGTAPFVGEWLVNTTGVEAAPGYYLAIMAALVLVTIVAGRVPETRGRQL